MRMSAHCTVEYGILGKRGDGEAKGGEEGRGGELLLNRRHSITLRGLHPSRMSNGNEIFVSIVAYALNNRKGPE